MAVAGIDAEVLAESGALVPRGTETAVLEFLSESLGNPYAGAEIGWNATSELVRRYGYETGDREWRTSDPSPRK